jgi:VWFA-related protein
VPSGSGAPTVFLRASVVDKSGNPVTNLPREAFKVFEDGVEQKIEVFRLEEGPLSIGVLVDISRSMKAVAADNLKQAVERFVGAAGPQDEFFLVEFNDVAYLKTPLTTDAGKLVSQLDLHRFAGVSAVRDVAYAAARYIREARNPRKALLIISDGDDNVSILKKAAVQDYLQGEDIQVYCIGLPLESLIEGSRLDPDAGGRLLDELSSPTGGVVLRSIKPKDLAEAAAQIAARMRSGYVLGYSPAGQRFGGRRALPTVKLSLPRGSPSLRVITGPGPKAPPQ